MGRLRCPVDRSELLEEKLGTANVAICRDCGGLWLARAARQSPSPDPAALPDVTKGAREVKASTRIFRLCPNCPSALSRERIQGIEIDRCKRCDGIWLDAGEYEVVRRNIEVAPPPVPPQQGRLSGTFGIHETVEQPDIGGSVLDLSLGVIEFLLNCIP